MKNAARILAIVFAVALVAATVTNAALINDSRRALNETMLRDATGHVYRYQLMVVVPDTDDSFFQGLLEGIDGQAPMADAAVQVFRYSTTVAGDAKRYFEIAQRIRVDGLIMYCSASADTPRLRADSMANGVAFVPVGTDPPLLGKQGFIGSGSLLQGMKGGSLVGARLGGSARVGIILPETGEGDLERDALYRGAASGLAAFRGARIVGALRGSRGILSGEEAAATLLRSGEVVNAIICTNAQDTEGVAQLVVDMNLVGRVMIIGADETPEIRRFIDRGVIAASIVRDSRRIGQEAVRAFALLKSGGLPGEAVEVGFAVRTDKGVQR
jgi:ribose transport system substrate-binding protein